MPSIFPVTAHTDYVSHGSTFVAINGFNHRGIDFIASAVQKGATKIIVGDDEVLPDDLCIFLRERGVICEYVSNTRLSLAQRSAQAAGMPANQLNIIGITGTKGKTTTSALLEHILKSSGFKTALVGTLGHSINGCYLGRSLTTPQSDYLHQFFLLCVQSGVRYVVMEVSAQALSLHRVASITFDHAVITNISREHLEFYASMHEYCQAKRSLSHYVLSADTLLINGDDTYLNGLNADTFGVGKHNMHRLMVSCVNDHSVSFFLDGDAFLCKSLLGKFNSYNCAAATIIAQKIGISNRCIQQALSSFSGVPGRMQFYDMPNGSRFVIDYAHNPSSYEAVLSLLRKMTSHLIVVFGASGSRDKGKRSLLGHVASIYADKIVLTSDNVGMADADEIIQHIMSGVIDSKKESVVCHVDRAHAIHIAFNRSRQGSIVALLGKGIDEYQIVGTQKLFFSERGIIDELRRSA